jgi:hypothetical protein
MQPDYNPYIFRLFQMFKNVTGTRLRVLVWVGFVVGCIAKFVTGSLFVYNVYQDDIKQAFNYTQRESKTILSLNILSFFFLFHVSFLQKFIGEVLKLPTKIYKF